MLNRDYKEMLSCLKEEGVEFIIVGAYALAACSLSCPRAQRAMRMIIKAHIGKILCQW
ncbi:hypothetical protein [Pyrinomonas methylaliphatogenes]|jgi:hypothetical protein|uniref:Uncharacterized protein n=1 Tax=Pyrinomonas methylaliphatogenes TaxID=454194 RepID=A0A0B6X081_9BACT|nr:hypothetical protein [Pyrinomonas methylaliphatogenes]CDM66736.1 hypothetical protein PYK22_02769 [Pyrinomonas methylaliphatogenes]